jgi:hypothetical protein
MLSPVFKHPNYEIPIWDLPYLYADTFDENILYIKV